MLCKEKMLSSQLLRSQRLCSFLSAVAILIAMAPGIKILVLKAGITQTPSTAEQVMRMLCCVVMEEASSQAYHALTSVLTVW